MPVVPVRTVPVREARVRVRQAPRERRVREVKPRAPRTSSRPRCPSGKVRYRDELEAGAVIAAARRSGKSYVPSRAYWCEDCDGHHLTSKPARPYPFHNGSDEARMRAMLEWTG